MKRYYLFIFILVNISVCKKVTLKEFNLSENPILLVEFEEIKEWYIQKKEHKLIRSKQYLNCIYLDTRL